MEPPRPGALPSKRLASAAVRARLSAIDDEAILQELFWNAARCRDLPAFRSQLPR